MSLPAVVGPGPIGGELVRRSSSRLQRVAQTIAKAFGSGLSGLTQASDRWVHIWDNFAGQWQQDVEVRTDSVLAFGAVFACLRLISADIGKLRFLLKAQSPNGIWRELPPGQPSPFRAVLRKPNPHQTAIKFREQWLISKLIRGNAYILKSRDARGVVTELRVIDPALVTPQVSFSGEVFYRIMPGDQLAAPALTGTDEPLTADVYVPAREIIHDVHLTPEHPLIGVSPLGACGLAATQGLAIQRNSAKFFGNQSRAGVVLTAAGKISDETAARLKKQWEANYGGDNIGRTAVLGDGLEPKPFTVNAGDAQLIEQLNWTSVDVCRAFGVPPYKIGIGEPPTRTTVEELDQAYYSQTLQELIVCMESLMTEGLELDSGPAPYCVELDVRDLLRLDTTTRFAAHTESIKGGWKAPNEVRLDENLEPVEGGDSPMLQQQNFSLAALAKRDSSPDPFKTASPAGGSGGSGGDGIPKPDAPTPDNPEGKSRLSVLATAIERTVITTRQIAEQRA